jgi:hypothetical protein
VREPVAVWRAIALELLGNVVQRDRKLVERGADRPRASGLSGGRERPYLCWLSVIASSHWSAATRSHACGENSSSPRVHPRWVT